MMVEPLLPIMNSEEKLKARKGLADIAVMCLNIPYEFGAKGKDLKKFPTKIDCSGLTKWIYTYNQLYIPDGSGNQYNFCLPAKNPQVGDLGFFLDKVLGIYHVGMVLNEKEIIEARGHENNVSFETGKVITRPRLNWETFSNWGGYRSHPELC